MAVVSLDGEVLRVAFRPVRTRIGLDGAATQDAVEWWTGLLAAAREAIAGAGADGAQLHVVAVTGQYGSSVPVGADGEPVGEVLLWADTRARDLTRPVIGGPVTIGGFAPHKVLPFVRITGGAPSPSGADPTGHWLLLRERLREVYEKTRVILEPVDYLGLRFTGRAAATPASMLASWITDNRVGAPFGYVDSLVAKTRRDPAKLPELLPTGTVLGTLLPEVAEELGVAAGVPVVCGIPDLHAAVVGSGAIAPYDTHIAISTTAWISCPRPLQAHRHPAPDRHRPGHRPCASDRRQQPGDRGRGAPLAARADRRSGRRPPGRRQRHRRGGRRRRGPGAVVRRPAPARRAGPSRVRGRAVHALAQRRTQPGGGQDACAPAG